MAQTKAFSLGGVGSPCCCGAGGGSGGYPCAPCAVPKQNLAISWVNSAAGNGSDTLVYSASGPIWATGCSGGAAVGNQLLFHLLCTGGAIELRIYYFVSGSCPTGQSNYCSNLRSTGQRLILSSYTCGDGFTLVFTLTSETCPAIGSSGYSSFTVTL